MHTEQDFETVYIRLMYKYIESVSAMTPEEMIGFSRACFKIGSELHLQVARQISCHICCEPSTFKPSQPAHETKILRGGKWVTGELNRNTLD